VSCIPGAVELAVIVDVVDVVSTAAADVSAAELPFFEQPLNAAPTTTSAAIVPSFLVIRCTLLPSLSVARVPHQCQMSRTAGGSAPAIVRQQECRITPEQYVVRCFGNRSSLDFSFSQRLQLQPSHLPPASATCGRR